MSPSGSPMTRVIVPTGGWSIGLLVVDGCKSPITPGPVLGRTEGLSIR